MIEKYAIKQEILTIRGEICYKNKNGQGKPVPIVRSDQPRHKGAFSMQEKELQGKKTDTNGSLERALSILEHMASYGIAESVPEISRKLKINKVTAYKLMRTLEERGYVRKNEGGKYIMSSRMFEFGSMFCNNNPLTHLFYQNANLLLKTIPTSEIYLGVLADNLRGVYLGAVATRDPYLNSGTGFPLYATAIGKVLLALERPEFQMQFFQKYEESSLTQYTASTVRETANLTQQLREIRRVGYCINQGEYIMNTYFAAAPIFGVQRELLAAVSIGANKDIFNANQDVYIRETQAFAARLSASMGCLQLSV